MIIHREYWSTELKIYPMLLFGKSYFVGVKSDDLSIPLLGIAPTATERSPQIVIPYTYTDISNFNEYITYNISWSGNDIIVNYFDTDFSTSDVTFRLYFWNKSLIDSTTYATSLVTHTW
ncbi:unnamed protein product, partial [marine sediment metagenome]